MAERLYQKGKVAVDWASVKGQGLQVVIKRDTVLQKTLLFLSYLNLAVLSTLHPMSSHHLPCRVTKIKAIPRCVTMANVTSGSTDSGCQPTAVEMVGRKRSAADVVEASTRRTSAVTTRRDVACDRNGWCARIQ